MLTRLMRLEEVFARKLFELLSSKQSLPGGRLEEELGRLREEVYGSQRTDVERSIDQERAELHQLEDVRRRADIREAQTREYEQRIAGLRSELEHLNPKQQEDRKAQVWREVFGAEPSEVEFVPSWQGISPVSPRPQFTSPREAQARQSSLYQIVRTLSDRLSSGELRELKILVLEKPKAPAPGGSDEARQTESRAETKEGPIA